MRPRERPSTTYVFLGRLRCRCVLGVNVVTSFDRHVARETSVEIRLWIRFAVFELSEPPTARLGVFLGIFDHELDIQGRTGNKRLFTSKYFIVFLRRSVTPGQPRNDCSVREWKPSFTIC